MLPEELALCAQACAAEGATWLHLHADNAALVRQAVNRIRACGLALADVHEARRLLGMQPVASPIIPVVGTLAS
jgi:uncharacterized protein (DUF849 family)